MNMLSRIKALLAEEGRNPWLIPVDDAICLAQYVIVAPIHIYVLSISLADVDRRIDKVGGEVGAGVGIEQRLQFSLIRLTDSDRQRRALVDGPQPQCQRQRAVLRLARVGPGERTAVVIGKTDQLCEIGGIKVAVVLRAKKPLA